MDSRPAGEHALEEKEVASLPSLGRLRCLSIRHISAIDDALVSIGEYGEVRLVKIGGKLRFVQTLKSRSLQGKDHG